MRCLIYGAGAVGLGLASFITKTGRRVDILAREETAEVLRKEGIVRTGILGSHTTAPGLLGVSSSLQHLADTPWTHVLLCTKSYDLENAARDVASCAGLLNRVLEGRCSVVLIQNGWGNAEVCTTYFPDQQIFNARVITGFVRKGPNHLDVTVHADDLSMGSLFGAPLDPLIELGRVIEEGGFPCRVTPEIEKDLWAKMLYNCALNPLGAIFGVPYGILGEWDYTRFIMDRIVHETFDVMQAAGYGTHWKSAEDYLKLFYDKLLPVTYGHESSTLQDIRRQSRTEIDALNGAVVRLGEGLGVDVTVNAVIYRMLRFLEERNMGLKPSY
jgi:2-dehydropantoate 2-reductase